MIYTNTATGGTVLAGAAINLKSADFLVIYRATDITHWHESEHAAGVAEATMRFTVCSDDYDVKNQVALLIRNSLHAFQGDAGGRTILHSEVTALVDNVYEDLASDWLYTRDVDVKFQYREPIPTNRQPVTADDGDIENSIAQYLNNHPSLAGIGVFPGAIPDDYDTQAGAIIYDRVTGGETEESEHDTGVEYPIIEYAVRHPVYGECQRIVETLRGILEGLQGTVGPTADCLAIWHEDESDAFYLQNMGTDDLYYVCPVKYKVIFDLAA